MNVDNLILYFKVKNDSALAERLQLSATAIHKWRRGGIPYREQCVLEVETGGVLKAKGARKYVQDLQ